MAETIVKLVLEKITDALVKEALHLYGVRKQVERVERELIRIQAFLKDADRKQIQDEMQKQWVKEVRDVAYWIEDVIDTFLCEVPQKKPGKREAIKRVFGKAKKLPIIHKLGDEMNQILARLQEINDMKDRYKINSLGEGTGGGKRLPVRPPVLPDIEDTDVVGLDADRDKIIKELLDETTPKRSVVSIVGPGGLGKTTLAKKVYNRY
jgi:flagellar biosynthesis GTPase FlhF